MGVYMPVAPSGGSGRIARPQAKTYQEQEEFDAQDAWAAAGKTTAGDVARSGAGRDSAAAAAAAAYAKYSGGPSVSGWSPEHTAGATPNNVAQWMHALPGGGSRAAGPGGPTDMGGGPAGPALSAPGAPGGPAGPGAPGGEGDFGDVSGFDPTAAMGTYAGGAIEKFNANLTGRLDKLQNQAVGAGRLRTGWYDRDQGSVATQLGKDFNADIAMQATTLSGQRLDALKAGAGLREQHAATGLEAAMGRERTYLGDAQSTADRAASYASSTRDYAAADRSAQDTRDEIARLRARNQTTAATPVDPYAAQREEARAYGVPFVG